MGLQPSPEGYEAVCRSVARTMVSESAARVQACLPQTVLFGLGLHWNFVVF